MKIFVICVMLTEFAKSHRVTHQNILLQNIVVWPAYFREKKVMSIYEWEADGQECVRWCLIDIPWWSHDTITIWSLSLIFWDPIFCQTKTLLVWSGPGLACEYEFLAVYGLGLSAQMSQWAWITGSQSLSHLCFKQWSADISCQTPSQAPGIPNSCSPIWIFMPHCQLPFSPDLSTVLGVHHPSKIWTLRRKEVKWAQITPRLGSWPCVSQCSVIQEERGAT